MQTRSLLRTELGIGHVHKYDLRDFKGRIFFVSDVHGHFDLLHEALRNVAFDSNTDLLFSGGDWTDRGPDSQHVLDYLDEPWIHSVRGNHEEMFIGAHESGYSEDNWNVRTLKAHGGDWIWKISDPHRNAIYKMFKELPLGIELILPRGRKVGIVHAEVPYRSWDKFVNVTQTELMYDAQASAQWARRWYDQAFPGQVEGVDFVLVGHTPTDSGEVERLGNMAFTDAGSFFRGKLNLIELNDDFMRKMK